MRSAVQALARAAEPGRPAQARKAARRTRPCCGQPATLIGDPPSPGGGGAVRADPQGLDGVRRSRRPRLAPGTTPTTASRSSSTRRQRSSPTRKRPRGCCGRTTPSRRSRCSHGSGCQPSATGPVRRRSRPAARRAPDAGPAPEWRGAARQARTTCLQTPTSEQPSRLPGPNRPGTPRRQHSDHLQTRRWSPETRPPQQPG